MEDIEYLRNCIVFSIGNEETGMTESCEEYKQVIDRVLDRLEQLEKENENLVLNALNSKKYIDNECIPKSVIREKLEELEQELKECNEREFCLYEDTINKRIKIYKELLGGSNE